MALVSILIVDDHAAVRNSIRSLMKSHSEWKVCGEAADGLEAIEKAAALQPHLVLMDLSMPRMGGLEATQIIRRQVPTTRVLVISQNDPTLSSRQAIAAGACGYISKSNLATDLIPAIENFATGARCSDTFE
ncbi:MAG TPA: response regulator transcription factor [Dongiaceae bacterium]|nr:response regulator transcription factor [Dongiaceae bacterium]